MKKFGEYFVTIGLEIHVALDTKEKLFSSTSNEFDVKEFSLFDVGTPGVLPVLSKEPVEMAIAFGKAVNAEIKQYSIFERKHYFYPDLPLGYQITQQHQPILIGGKVKIDDDEGKEKWVQIEHAHLECDAAKSIHDMYQYYSAIDISRCASPLLEIVSTPCMHSPEEAKQYAKSVHSLVTFMKICDGKLEEGSFRVDASISLSKISKLGTRVEIKNISSFAFLKAALDYEIERQTEILDAQKEIVMETRLFNEKDLATYSMRKKETVDEYRYMPDPDIMPLIIEDELLIEVEKKYDITYFDLKEKVSALLKELKIVLKEEEVLALIFGKLRSKWKMIIEIQSLQTEKIVRMMSFWIQEVVDKLNDENEQEIAQKRLASLDENHIKLLEKSDLQAKECKETIRTWLLSDEKTLTECMPQLMPDEKILPVMKEVLTTYKEQVDKYKEGEIKMEQFLMGKVLSILKGKASAQSVKRLLQEILQA